jgi:predicted MFS family arabinose efflux permease
MTNAVQGYLSRFKLLFSGMLPLFMLAHFGHHVVGAMISPLLPMIRDDLSLNYTTAGVLVSVFSIVGGIAQLPAGWLADKVGSRIMILISVTGVACGGVLIGLSNSYGMLLVLLGITAMLGGGYHPAAASSISAMTPPQRRGRALGLHLIGGTSSFWVTMFLVAPMAAAWSWRTPFIVLSIPVAVLGLVLFYVIGKRLKAGDNVPSASKAKASPVTEATAIRWRVFLPFLILTVGSAMIIQSAGAYYSMYAADKLGVSKSMVVLLMAISPFVGMFAAPLGGYLADRIGGIPVVILSCLVAGPLLYVVSLVPNGWAFVPVLVAIGVVNMARAPSAETYFVTQIPANRRATILGIYFFAGAELAGLMTPLVGRLIDKYGFSPVLTWSAVAVVSLTLICTLFLWRNIRTARLSS